mgnify:CR=1 FL=1
MNNELNFLIYNTPEENISINAVVKEETIWLTQKAMWPTRSAANVCESIFWCC